MKKNFSKLTSMICLCALILSCGTAFASSSKKQDEITVCNKPKVIIDNPDLNIPNEIIQDIINDNPDADEIRIHDYYDAEKDTSRNILKWRYDPSTVKNLVKKTTEWNAEAKDLFVASAARGMTTWLSSEWTGSLNSSITGECTIGNLGLKEKVEKKYSVTHKFEGPNKNSRYNSIEYRIRFYENRGTYTADWSSGVQGPGSVFHKVSGNWTEPTKYAAYSKYHTIK